MNEYYVEKFMITLKLERERESYFISKLYSE